MGVSVAVSAWTLVSISIERYNAICHPLKSRRWQTLSHSYKVIVVIWVVCLTTMTPIAVLSQLIPLHQDVLAEKVVFVSRLAEENAEKPFWSGRKPDQTRIRRSLKDET
ncbi:unnamed protein product [Darwinula stevensoni]|uniref:G-protein coupled receptors family 1 profile domain-containing protein n=1 Tax=Darwinula stevensoni TaxID=69355 RepID=A0A7R8X8F5_9CRUS|nr:unnamed protein product [Darwinula stevensoni]CAG0881492.1 unnamed protein product [Darwinula stevensoni]